MTRRAFDVAEIETPIGTMIAATTDRGVCMLEFADSRHLASEMAQLAAEFGSEPLYHGTPPPGSLLDDLARQLDEYFSGRRREFDIALELVGTEFQKRVWEGLRRIPYGHTVSYGEQAAALGRPTAVRAVAGANGRNKISIVLPCHRVIGADGSLTGYGGGVERKKALINYELRIKN